MEIFLSDMTMPSLQLCVWNKDSSLNTQSFGTPTGQRLGTISNGMRFGQVAALFVIAPLIQKFGRRVPIAIGSSILLVGVILQTAAQNYGMFVVGRILVGFGNNIQQTTCPILLAELTYPDQRPKLVGITNTTGSLGQLMAAVSEIDNTHSCPANPSETVQLEWMFDILDYLSSPYALSVTL